MSTAAAARRSPADEYVGPPKEWFFGEAWFERDIQAVFRPKWIVAGHVDELTGANPYLAFALGNEEVLIRRDAAGRLSAFRNFCTHRGARLCEGRTGNTPGRRIVCPYHQWTFSSDDGALMTAHHMHEDFDRQPWGLARVHVSEWMGIIFVCMAEERPTELTEYLGDFKWGGWDFGGMKLAATKAHRIQANWKIVIENNMECYHCAAVHPELNGVYNWQYLQTSEQEYTSWCAERGAGLEVFDDVAHSANTIGGKRVCAVDTPRLSPDEPFDELDSIYQFFEPGVVMNISRDHGWLFVPKPIGPDLTELRQFWFVPKDAEEGRDYTVDELMSFWVVTMDQDKGIVESIQRGMSDPAYKPGPLNRTHQSGQAGFFHWYTSQIEAHFPSAAARGRTASEATANSGNAVNG